MDILNAFTGDMFDKIVAEAARLTKRTNKKTLSSREVLFLAHFFTFGTQSDCTSISLPKDACVS